MSVRSLLLAVTLLFAGSASAQTFYHESEGSVLGFGSAVVLTDGELLIGSASVDWPAGADPVGEVYRYRKNDAGQWVEVGRIGAPDAEHGDEFGRSLTVHGNQLFVGAPAKASVYVFQRAADDSWTYERTLSPASLPDGFEFGGAYARGGYRTQTIARVGNKTFVTSYNGDTNDGSVYMMSDDGSGRVLVDAPAWAVVASGSTLYVGVPTTNDNRGGVLVYEQGIDGMMTLAASLDGSDLGAGAMLGRSLAASDTHLYVGAIKEGGSGSVVVYEYDGEGSLNHMATWTQPINDGDRANGDFGHGMALSANELLVGARGAAFVFNVHHADVAPIRLDAPAQQRGKNFGVGVAIEGDVLAVGAPSADYGAGRAIIYERAADGTWQEANDATGDVTTFESITGTEKQECEDGKVEGLFPCENVDLVSFISVGDMVQDRGANLNDVWGWEDPDTGREYVLAGRTDGLSFVDIGDPARPVIVGQIMRTDGSPGSWWRDVKVYRNHAYIVADGAEQHGVQIFDLTRLRDVRPQDMPVTFEVDALYTELASVHNIVINEETGFAYAVGSDSGGESCGGQLYMMDLKDPLNPEFVGCYVNEGTGGTHDAQCVVYQGPDDDHRGQEICMNSNGSAFVIADVTDKSNATTIAVATYPNTAYTHQGWLSEDHRYFFMNDELDEMNKIVDRTRTLIWDVTDLDEPILVKEYLHGNGASDHNLYVKGNYMYQSNYQSGLRVLDITDPLNPIEFGHFDTAPYADNVYGFGGSWSNYPYFKSGIIVVSSQAEGLFMVRKREVDL